MQPLDFGPGVAFLGEILDQPNWNLAFDTLAIRFSSLTKEQYPRFSVATTFPFQPTALISLRHCRPSFNRPLALSHPSRERKGKQSEVCRPRECARETLKEELCDTRSCPRLE